MPRYMVERTFPGGLALPANAEGAEFVQRIIRINGDRSVNWVHSYVSADKAKTFCIYDAPAPETIRQVAKLCGLPVDNITEISVLDPYFHH